MEARDMGEVFIDPAEIAGEIAVMISCEKGISTTDALVLFMQSNTYWMLIYDPKKASLGTSRILSMYYEEVGGHDRGLTEFDHVLIKMGVTRSFAEKYDTSYAEAATLFKENGIYEYLDEIAEGYINQTYPYMANHVARRLGIPVRAGPGHIRIPGDGPSRV